jgi:hypothetical protein
MITLPEMSRIGKTSETICGWGWGEKNKVVTVSRYQFFGGDENILELVNFPGCDYIKKLNGILQKRMKE